MTEAEWLSATDPMLMMLFLRKGASDRKLRLVACASCRRQWCRLPGPVQQVVEVAEQFVDGGVTPHRWAKARRGASRLERVRFFEPHLLAARRATVEVVHQVVLNVTHLFYFDLVPSGGYDPAASEAYRREWASQADLVRDIFGNPFRPPAVDPSWLTTDVRLLAAGIYEERAFDRMPILADALMDAGCADDDLLGHLRSESPHVRGCWALDLVLGRG